MKFNLSKTPVLLCAAATLSFTADHFVSETYKFDSEIVMEMKQYKGEEVTNDSRIRFYASSGDKNMGYIMDINTHGQSMSAQVVMDAKANTMTTLVNQGGMKMAMQYDLSKGNSMAGMGGKAAEDAPTDKIAKAEVKKTGRSKTILGYKCDEYEIVSEESYGLAWVAPDMPFPSFYESFSKIPGAGSKMNSDMPKGFPMLIESWPDGKGTDQKYVIEVVEVNKDKGTTISTEGYQVMKLN